MEKNNCKTNSVRFLGDIDIQPLTQMLLELHKEWDTEESFKVNINKTYSLSQVYHVNFRWSKKLEGPCVYFDLELWSKYKHLLLPIMQKAVAPIGYKKGYFPRVMLAKMHPGKIIPEHIDGDSLAWIPHKIHIPLITNPQVTFSVKGIDYHFEKGKAYEVDNSGMHGVKNEGNTTRIHLIFEYLDAEINDVPKPDFEL
jgi:hypothetical protein